MKTVLLLDDDAQFRALLVPELEARGFRVLEAAKGRIARRLLLVEQPDLAIVDGLLPDTNGLRWIEETRASRVRIPILFVSAFFKDLASFRRLTEELGVAHVLHKPVRPDTLARVAEQVCGAAADAPPYPSRLPPEQTAVGLEVDVGALEEAAPEEVEEDVFFLPAASEYELEVDELAASFAARLPSLVVGLRASAEAAGRGEEPGGLEAALTQAHQLHGTAGSYGHAEVGEAAGRLEDVLRAAVDAGDAPAPEALAPALSALDRALEALPVPTPIRDVLGFGEEAGPHPDDLPAPSFASHPDSQWPELVGPGVLVVDTDPALRAFFRTVLADRLVRLRTVATFDEAVAEAEREAPDLAFVGMPFGDPDRSTGLVARLRSLPGCGRLPVAALAARDDMQTRREASHVGVDLFLAHPLDGRALESAIRRLRDAREADRLRVTVLATGKGTGGAVVGPLAAAGFDVETFGSLPRLLAGTRDHPPDAVVVNAGSDGPELCRLIRSSALGDEVAVLLLGEGDTDAALLAGADDVLGPTSHWKTVIRARTRRVRTSRAHLPFCPVTQLPRRDFVCEALASRLSAAQRHGRSYTLAIVRLDGRAELAEAHGRTAGERAVGELGRLLFARFRLEDVRGRWGEDAFLLGFDEVSAEVMAPVVRRVQEEFSALVLQGGAGRRFRASFSAGLASAHAMDVSLKSLLLRAERRLEVAAGTGPSGLAFRDPLS